MKNKFKNSIKSRIGFVIFPNISKQVSNLFYQIKFQNDNLFIIYL